VKQSIISRAKDQRDENNGHDFESGSAELACSNEQHIIAASKVVLCQQLGAGEFGDVWQGAWKYGTGQQVAFRR